MSNAYNDDLGNCLEIFSCEYWIFRTISGDGSSQVREGTLKQLEGSKEGPVSVMQGSYSYIGSDGQTYSVDWKADGISKFFLLKMITVIRLCEGFDCLGFKCFQKMDSKPLVIIYLLQNK